MDNFDDVRNAIEQLEHEVDNQRQVIAMLISYLSVELGSTTATRLLKSLED